MGSSWSHDEMFSGCEMTTDNDADVPQRELERTTMQDRMPNMKLMLEVYFEHFLRVYDTKRYRQSVLRWRR